MRIASLLLFVLFVVSFSACEINRIQGKIGGASVDVGDRDSRKDSSHFCPPGQAKKGNC
jgi:hypothetical protein